MKEEKLLESKCGSCAYWNSAGAADFRERLKSRFREPFCTLNNKVRYENEMKGCLAWKQAGAKELQLRGILRRELEEVL